MHKEYWNNEYQRKMEITLEGDNRPVVTVYQSSTLRHHALKGPTINWVATGDSGPEIAEQFALAVIVAADCAREWDKDTGKNSEDVFKLPQIED